MKIHLLAAALLAVPLLASAKSDADWSAPLSDVGGGMRRQVKELEKKEKEALASACRDPEPDAAAPTAEGARQDAALLLDSVRNILYPELKGVDIRVVLGDSREYFLRTDIEKDLNILAADGAKRRYSVILSSRYLKCMPGEKAVQSILAHELWHIRDYAEMDAKTLLAFGFLYATDARFVAGYERATDKNAIARAAREKVRIIPGLIQYRKWQYAQMEEKYVEKKKKNYLSLDELRDLQKDGGE